MPCLLLLLRKPQCNSKQHRIHKPSPTTPHLSRSILYAAAVRGLDPKGFPGFLAIPGSHNDRPRRATARPPGKSVDHAQFCRSPDVLSEIVSIISILPIAAPGPDADLGNITFLRVARSVTDEQIQGQGQGPQHLDVERIELLALIRQNNLKHKGTRVLGAHRFRTVARPACTIQENSLDAIDIPMQNSAFPHHNARLVCSKPGVKHLYRRGSRGLGWRWNVCTRRLGCWCARRLERWCARRFERWRARRFERWRARRLGR